MPPSQLKRLKTSLRDQGVVGPQKSKKQKKQAGKNGVFKDKRVARDAALHGIREQFNPFEVKVASRDNKYQFVNGGHRASNGVVGRPGVTKGLGEETRRRTLLMEMQRRKKVGGIMDRRFGENDPTMTPEERAMERFVREKQSGGKRGSMFDLEEEMDAGDGGLTHLGQSLSFDKGEQVDDFDEAEISRSEASDADAEGERRSRKRRRLSETGIEEVNTLDDQNEDSRERPKTKQEVMKEVITKSKFHKYERQKAKEDDDDLRAELDQGLADIYSLLRSDQARPKPPQTTSTKSPEIQMNPDRAALLNGKDRLQADKEYDERLRQMAFDARSKPTTRTKTEEEKLEEEAKRLKELEENRLARMRGEDSDTNAEDDRRNDLQGDEDDDELNEDPTGLGPGITLQPTAAKELDVEDEDDFIIDSDLIAHSSDVDLSDEVEEDPMASGEIDTSDDEKEFVQGLLSKDDIAREEFKPTKVSAKTQTTKDSASLGLAFTYPCPETHNELLDITKDVSIEDLPTIIQRIRALYHPKLNAENKPKLAIFSAILVDHISYLANQPVRPPFHILETLIRHTHSLAKSFPDEVGAAFRRHLKSLQDERPMSPSAADLVLFTAIATIFPTSDHFHQVVTPAMLSMARYLGQKIPQTLGDLARGTYVTTLCVQYQRLSKRYVPEVVNYCLNTLSMLAPTKPSTPFGPYPSHKAPDSLRIGSTTSLAEPTPRKLQFWDIEHQDGHDASSDETLKLALLSTHLTLISHLSSLWSSKSSFPEIFTPFHLALTHLSLSPSTTPPTLFPLLTHLSSLLHTALLARRPLQLHHHRPLAIKTSIPKFEESYNPAKHYDPDRERAELAKLKAEHKREKKGALRELRKDASFVAREELRAKKERDEAYARKYKRLVAEIQGEEGREAKGYEREKRERKGRGRGRR